MNKTKIVCTIGPACDSDAVLEKMIKAGMSVARFNFSHGTHEEHRIRMDAVKRVREKLGVPVAIMLDTKGPEFRTGILSGGSVTLAKGDRFDFRTDGLPGDKTGVSVSYRELADELCAGDTVLVNNGLLVFRVTGTDGGTVRTEVVNGGVLTDRKSMSFPGKVMKMEYLSEQDKSDLLFGIENDVDFVACSFVSSRADLDKVRSFMHDNGGDGIDLIAKIENGPGVEAIDEIIDAGDGIMIARGDMGVEIAFEKLPAIQKKMITACRFRGKRVITATEMLESMIHNPRPTRAEISDVANAVYDGTSAVMLSGETAAGEYPVEAVETMSRIAGQAEADIDYRQRFRTSEFRIKNANDAVSHAACALAIDVSTELIAVCSRSGATVRMVSRFRPPMPILGLTTDIKVWRKLALSWAVVPVLAEEFQSVDVLIYHAVRASEDSGLVKPGGTVVITAGQVNGKTGNTSLIKLETV